MDGCNGEIKIDGKYVYHQWDGGYPMSELGRKLDKLSWITEQVVDN